MKKPYERKTPKTPLDFRLLERAEAKRAAKKKKRKPRY